MIESGKRCRLIVTLEVGAAAPAQLEAALAAGDIACVVLEPTAGAKLEPGPLHTLVAMGQKAGAAVLLADDADLVRTVGADGAHLTQFRDSTRYRDARTVIGDKGIVGGDAGRSRDAAMRLGEAGANYVGFGIPDFVGDRETAQKRRLDLIAWWAELFEVPGVAFDVESADVARDLMQAGADFVALRLRADAQAASARDAVRAVLAAIGERSAQAANR